VRALTANAAPGCGPDLMFRWFIDLGLDEKVLDASIFSQNQKRLLPHEVADRFFAEAVNLARDGGGGASGAGGQTRPHEHRGERGPRCEPAHPQTHWGNLRLVKTTGCFRKSRYRGIERTHAAGQYVVATLNLLRMAKLKTT